MHPNAQWIWNDGILNTMLFQFDLGNWPAVLAKCDCLSDDTPSPTSDTPCPTTDDGTIPTETITPAPSVDETKNCTAKICAHGDNTVTLDVSYDGGSNWDLGVATENNWQDTMTAVINPIDANTIFRFTVVDWGSVGGFLCTVTLCGTNGYIFDFYTDEINTYFDVISDTSGDLLIDVFDAFGDGPWGWHVNADKVECMNEEADWIWNDQVGNTMVFELDLGHHPDILKKLDCIDDVTPAPTPDCCEISIDEYLEMCYCESDTPSPSFPPITHVTGIVIGDVPIDIDPIDAEPISKAQAGGINLL
eukprot:411592_1